MTDWEHTPLQREQRHISLQTQNDFLIAELRKRDLAEAERKAAEQQPAPDNYLLRSAQASFEREFTNHLEEYRQGAWLDASPYRTKPVSPDSGWPKGVDPAQYVRKFWGLNAEGTALIGETAPTQDGPAPTFLDDAMAKALRGTE